MDYSFKKLNEINGVTTFYTKPSTIHQYNTAEEVLKDYTDLLDHIGSNKWKWIIDGDGFEIKYALEMKTGMGVAKLLTGSHGDNLQEIKIINPSLFIRAILQVLLPILNTNTRKKVKIYSDRYYSLLEFL